MVPLISCRNLSFMYQDHSLLFKDVNFDVFRGNIGVLMGRSGAGKTTLFHLLTGYQEATCGEILVNELRIKDARHLVTFMTHEDLLLPWRSVMENVLLPAELSSSLNADILERAQFLLDRVGLYKCRDLLPEKLSQGMRQRVSLARTLLLKRPFVLLDEPFGALDLLTRHEMYELVYSLVKDDALSLLLITHDLRDCTDFADQLFILKNQTVVEESVSILQSNKNDASFKEFLV